MVHVRQGFFHYRAFWLTAGLSAGAATWVLAIEPVGTPILLEPVPTSNVIQTQAQVVPQPLRTQQPTAAGAAIPTQGGTQKSAVQLKLEELYQQDGRQMPDLPDPQIPRQVPGQSGQTAASAQVPAAAAGSASPGSAGVPARPVSSVAVQPSPSAAGAGGQQGQPQNASWAQAQSAGASRSTPAKKVPWIEQINPFKKRVSAAPPTEPAEIQYDPRRASGQFAQPQQPAQIVQQPVLQPGQVNPQTGRQNYSQLFTEPQTFATPAPQGDPFVATPPMSAPPTAQFAPAGAAPAPSFAPPVTAQAQQPAFAPQPPATFVPPTALPAASPAPATPVASLPILQFQQPVPVGAAPMQPAATPMVITPSQPAVQVAQLPLVLPQNPPNAAGPQTHLPQAVAPAAPPSFAPIPEQRTENPFTGLGLNDTVSSNAAIAVPAPAAGTSAAPAVAPPLQVAAIPTPVAAPAVPVAVAPPVAPTAPQSLPKLDGFFSAEEETRSDQRVATAPPEQSPAIVVPTPPPVVEAPVLQLPTTPAAAPLVVASPALPAPPVSTEVPLPTDVAATAPAALPKLEFPPIAAAPEPMPAKEVVQPGSPPPLKPVPRQMDGAAASKMALIAARSDQRGLKGFCPVMLRDHRELVDARPEHRSFYRNRIILLSSQEAKVVFESDPAKYAPAAAGNDVIHLSQTGEELEGSLEHAVWYKGRLYMFDSAETLETFVAAPSSHATLD